MKTNQVLTSRELFGEIVEQRTQDSFFNLTNLVKAGNIWRSSNKMILFNFSAYLKSKQTTEFIQTLEGKYGKVIVKSRSKNEKTWGHPLLFIDLALAISPALKVEVYEWIMDLLVRYRCESADSYVVLCGVLYQHATDKANFNKNMPKVANMIKIECGLDDDMDWNRASEAQLIKRERIHSNIIGLCGVLKDANKAIKLGILQTRQQLGVSL